MGQYNETSGGILILGIDPSLKSTGWAVMSNTGTLIEFGHIKGLKGGNTKERTIDMCHMVTKLALSLPYCSVILEIPQDYGAGSKTSANNIMPLWAVVGAVVGVSQNRDVTLVTPREWKGTMPKAKFNLVVLNKLHKEAQESILKMFKHSMASMKKRSLRKNVDDPIGDVLDAVGLCHKSIVLARNKKAKKALLTKP